VWARHSAGSAAQARDAAPAAGSSVPSPSSSSAIPGPGSRAIPVSGSTGTVATITTSDTANADHASRRRTFPPGRHRVSSTAPWAVSAGATDSR